MIPADPHQLGPTRKRRRSFVVPSSLGDIGDLMFEGASGGAGEWRRRY